MQTNIRKVHNIKLIVRVLPDSTNLSLYTQVCSDLITKLNDSYNTPQRFRLYPSFIYDSITDKKLSLSSEDVNVLNAVKGSIQRFSTEVSSSVSGCDLSPEYNKKKSSIKTQLFHFIANMTSKISTLNDISYKPTITYNILVDDIIAHIEAETSHIIMSASDQPRIINSKQIPQDLLSEKDMSLIVIINSTSTDLQTVKKPITENSVNIDKPISNKNKASKKSSKKKGLLLAEKLAEPLTIDTTSASSTLTSSFENTTDLETLKRIEAITSLKD